MKKTELTLKQMVEAVKANVDKPWEGEIAHKPVEREIKPAIPEELLQYDQTDIPYDVWIRYIG